MLVSDTTAQYFTFTNELHLSDNADCPEKQQIKKSTVIFKIMQLLFCKQPYDLTDLTSPPSHFMFMSLTPVYQ